MLGNMVLRSPKPYSLAYRLIYMSVYCRARGFVLKKTDLREADQVFVVYTEDFGKIEILGRGIRKIKSKIRPGIDIYYLSEIDFAQSRSKTLTGATAIERFKNIRNSPERLNVAYKIADAANNLITGQEKDGQIWNLLEEVFTKLNDWKLKTSQSESEIPAGLLGVENSLVIIYFYFFWHLLSILGYKPDLYHCAFCGEKLRPEKNYFIPKSGIFCTRCADSMRIRESAVIELSQDAIKILRILDKRDWKMLVKLKIEKTHLEDLRKILAIP